MDSSMSSRILLVLLVTALVLSIGCIITLVGSSQVRYVCFDGSTVSDGRDCPAPEEKDAVDCRCPKCPAPVESASGTVVSTSLECGPDSLYVASKNSKTYHLMNCSYAQRIDDANKVCFSDEESAIAAGYSPCKFCIKEDSSS